MGHINIIIPILILILITVIIINSFLSNSTTTPEKIKPKNFDKNRNENENGNENEIGNENENTLPFITPKSYSTGYLIDPPQKLANMCGDVLYTITPTYVDYSNSNTNAVTASQPSNCQNCNVTTFNLPP